VFPARGVYITRTGDLEGRPPLEFGHQHWHPADVRRRLGNRRDLPARSPEGAKPARHPGGVPEAPARGTPLCRRRLAQAADPARCGPGPDVLPESFPDRRAPLIGWLFHFGRRFLNVTFHAAVLDEAAKGGYGVGAFNVNNLEQIQAIMEAARATKSPVIIQGSRGARAPMPTIGSCITS